MIIRDLEFYLVAGPAKTGEKRPHSLIVRLVSHAGAEGWGEATDVILRQEDLLPLRNRLLPVLMGRSVYDLEELVRLHLHPIGPIRFAIETACWDIIGRLGRQPICHFFGGKYRTLVPMTVELSGRTHEERLRTSQELANRGYHWQVLTLTGRLTEDLLLVESLLDTPGPRRVELCVDAGGLYTRENCERLLAGLVNTGVSLLIDPFCDATSHELSLLQKSTAIPFGVCREIDSAHDVLDLAAYDNLSRLILEPQRIGSLLELRKCADIAGAAGLQCSIRSRFSMGPIIAAMSQVAAAMPAISHGIFCFSEHLETSLLQDAFDTSDGLLHLLHGPGIGSEIDRSKLERTLIA